MAGKALSSSSRDVNTLNETSDYDGKDCTAKGVAVKSVLISIKKEPDSSNYSETTYSAGNIYKTDPDSIRGRDGNFETKIKSEPYTHNQNHNDSFEPKSEDPSLGNNYTETIYSTGNICKTDPDSIKHEKDKDGNFKTKVKSELYTHNQNHNDSFESKGEDPSSDNYSHHQSNNQSISEYDIETYDVNNIKQEDVDVDNTMAAMGQNEDFDVDVESESELMEPKIQNLGMFGISEMFNFTSPEEIIKCKYCNFETKHKNQLWGHMQIHNDSLELKNQDVTLYKCPFPQCEFQTIYRYSITKHLNTHKTQKYKCSKCSYVTLQPNKYKQHTKSCEKVPEGTLLQCDQCDFKVKTQGLLLVHKRKHKNESKLLKCPECDLTTMYASALKKHVEKHRREENMVNLFTCTKCSYRSPSKTMLMRHEKVHGKEKGEGEGKYQCSDCSYQTMDLSELESHMLEHKGDKLGEIGALEGTPKTYHCPECSFKTTVISKANHHKNLHIRQRNGEIYKCEHCNYETMYKYLLKRHSLKHKDTDQIITYPCDLCDYRAKLKDYLVRHKRTHMKKELQQYKCTVCLFETIYKHTFKEHLARHNISLVDVKKFLSDKPSGSEGGSVYVSEEVVDLQNVINNIAPANSTVKPDSELT